MKKYILVVLGVFLCVSGAVAENIESVSFNPARLGRFERLKVSDTLSTKGALQTDAATINGNSSGVTIDNAGNYVIGITKANSTVELLHATLTPKTLNLYGGTATFSEASEVKTMEQSGNVPANVKAATLAMTGHAITITGGGTNYNNDPVRGLKLGSNDIPVPDSDDCSGSLGWYDLSTRDHYKYKVLGCGSTSTTIPPKKPCLEPTLGCPAGQIWNRLSCKCEGDLLDYEGGIDKDDEKTTGTWTRIPGSGGCQCLRGGDTAYYVNGTSIPGYFMTSAVDGDTCYSIGERAYMLADGSFSCPKNKTTNYNVVVCNIITWECQE